MKDLIIKGEWYYYVQVSKDSPKNIYRGMWHNLPDTEYHRGYFAPGSTTTLKEAKQRLSYYEKGYIEKRRSFRQGGRSWSETQKVVAI